MPNNFRHIGLIHLLMPNAKIIDVRREPAWPVASAIWKQLFASGQEFTYTLEDIAALLPHLSRPDATTGTRCTSRAKVLRVEYEDVVEDLEGNVRRILGFCELEFEPACLEFYKTGRSIRTASSEQVRQPLFVRDSPSGNTTSPGSDPLKERD